MQTPKRNFFKTGIIHFMAFPETIGGEGPVVETVKRIVTDDYFDAISVSWIKDSGARKEVGKMFAQSQMTVAYGAHPRLLSQGLNLNHLDKAERAKALATLKEGVDEALEIGASSFVFLSGKWEEATQEDSYKALVDSTLELCEYAKSQGDLEMVHENFDQDIDKASLIGPTPLAVRYAEEVRKSFPGFGLLVDLSHIPLIGESPKEALLPVKDLLATVDIGNCVKADPSLPRYGDTHPCFGYPNGENDVPELVEFLQVLLDIRFLNENNPPVVSFEVRPGEGEDSEVTIANSKRTLNAAWARVD